MKTIKIAICDDEPVSLKFITSNIQTCFLKEGVTPVLSTFLQPGVLSDEIKRGVHYDVLFLDIDMPEINGLQIAELCSQQIPTSVIVFITSYNEQIYQAIRLQPFRFIRKKMFNSEISECIHSLLKDIPNSVKNPYVTVSCNNTFYRFDVNQITYIECLNKHLTVHCKNREVTFRYTLSSMEELLKDFHFIRIHKSYLVNGAAIFTIEAKEVVLDDGTRLPLSRIYAQSTKDQFQEMFIWDIL